MAVKKKNARKKPVVRTAKTVKKDIRSLKKGLKKEVALAQRVNRKTAAHGRELELLKKEIEMLAKKRKKVSLSDYNRFMRAQIMRGLTFKQSVRLWNKGKREAAEKNKKRTSYNVFISMQLKQGKTMKQAIRAWNRLKNPPKRRRRVKKAPKVIIKRKIIIRRIPAKKRKVKRAAKKVRAKRKAARRRPVRRKQRRKRRVMRRRVVRRRRLVRRKPRRKRVRRKRTVRRRVVSRRLVRSAASQQPVVVQPQATSRSVFESRFVEKPVIVEKEVFPGGLAALVEEVQKGKTAAGRKALKKVFSERVVSESAGVRGFGDEELVLNLLDIYFTEVIRHGLKRSLTLDEIINAYFYALLRVERKGIELQEIEKIINKGVIRKENFRSDKTCV
ncbi:MAG: hypothetical protein NTW59_00995 [Candidatus Diapherotrites archaeon]|nr:hypothetical protein [Candidatus Diapherotrites archaeon]